MGKSEEYNIKSDPGQKKDLYSLIRKNSLYVLLERSVVPIINFLVTVYIIRKLSVDEFGIYNILFAVMGYISLFSSVGLVGVFRRFIPEFYQKGQIANLKKLVEKGLLWRFVVCGGIILIILFFSEAIGNLFKFGTALQYLAIFSIGIIFYLESGLLITTITSVFHHKLYVTAQIIYVIFRAGFIYYLLATKKGLVGLLIAESISFGLLFILQFFYYRKFLSLHYIRQKAELPLRRLLRFGGFSYFNEMGAQILSVSTDYFIISAFLGPAAVGIYAFANRIMILISHVLPQSMFMSIIRPAFFSKYVQDNDPVQMNKMFNFLMKMIAFFLFPILTGIFILGDKLIIYVFDPKYLGSLNVLWIVAAFTALNSFINPVGLVLESKEKVQIIFFSKIFAIYNLIFDFLVVKTYGVIGIAIVTGSAVLFKNIFMYLFAKKYTNLTIEFKSFGIIVANSLFMGLLIYPFRTQIKNITSLILITIIGALIYFLTSYVNKAFSKKEREIMNKILPKPVFIF